MLGETWLGDGLGALAPARGLLGCGSGHTAPESLLLLFPGVLLVPLLEKRRVLPRRAARLPTLPLPVLT